MKVYIKSNRGMNIDSIIPWNGYFYGIQRSKKLGKPDKYFRAKSVRFDDTFGGTEEITPEEYSIAAKEYHNVMD